MLPLYRDLHFLFRFDENRSIDRFHLEGVDRGRRVEVFRFDPATGTRLDRLATAVVGTDGWVELPQSIVVRAGEAFIAAPQP